MSTSEEVHVGCVIYPVCVNRLRSFKKGRKVPLDCAVNDPTIRDIAMALQKLKVPFEVQADYRHPSDFTYGRVKAVLKDDKGALLNSEYPNKRQLLIAVGQMLQAMESVRIQESGGNALTSVD